LPNCLAKHPHREDFVRSPDGGVIKIRVEKYYLVRRFHEVVEIAIAGVTPRPGEGNLRRRRGFSPSGGSPCRGQEKNHAIGIPVWQSASIMIKCYNL
jgi:hypothetical protein